MKVETTKLEGVVILTPNVYSDNRGYYTETYNKSVYDKIIGDISFIQDNEAQSEFGVFRGLHFQEPPYTQAKLIRVTQGAIIDVIVDIRTDSKTFKEMLMIRIDDNTNEQIFIPRGFAHGYFATEDDTIIQYKVDNKYEPTFDSGIKYDSMGIDLEEEFRRDGFIMSDKDLDLNRIDDVILFETKEYHLNG